MVRLIVILLCSFALITACTDAPVDPDPEPEPGDKEPIESVVTINNPGEGDVLEGEVTVSIEGEAENGFSELRVFMGEELLKTIESPTFPLEQKIKTYHYPNGTYDLSAELDVAGQDTTISASISVTLENYMVILETEGYIEVLKLNTESTYLFIADPDGNVIHDFELTAENDGVIKMLPPEALENGAPEWFSITIGQQFTDPIGRERLSLTTDVGFKPWSRVYRKRIEQVPPSAPRRALTVQMYNFEQPPLYTAFQITEYVDENSVYYQDVYRGHPEEVFFETIDLPDGPDDLVITTTPDFNRVDPVPVYRWEDNLTGLGDTVSYNVAEDFSQMAAHNVAVPSNITVDAYAYFMTVVPNSFERADVNFAYWSTHEMGDANGSNPGFGMWVPELPEQTFITFFAGHDESKPNISYRYQSPIGDFPGEFNPLDANVQILNSSFDNLQLQSSGSFDYMVLNTRAETDAYVHSWRAILPNDTESFIFPKIAERLDPSVSHYNRSSFELTTLILTDSGKLSGHSDYLKSNYGTADFGHLIEFNQIIQSLAAPAKQKWDAQSIPSSAAEMMNYSPYGRMQNALKPAFTWNPERN